MHKTACALVPCTNGYILKIRIDVMVYKMFMATKYNYTKNTCPLAVISVLKESQSRCYLIGTWNAKELMPITG